MEYFFIGFISRALWTMLFVNERYQYKIQSRNSPYVN